MGVIKNKLKVGGTVLYYKHPLNDDDGFEMEVVELKEETIVIKYRGDKRGFELPYTDERLRMGRYSDNVLLQKLDEYRGDNKLHEEYDDPCNEWEYRKNGEFIQWRDVVRIIRENS